MTFLRSAQLIGDALDPRRGHPYNIPALMALNRQGTRLGLNQPVTLFVGDNGSGKSTLLEAIAISQSLNAEGGSRHMRFETRGFTTSTLFKDLQVSRTAQVPRDAFFLRAESYFNVATAIEEFSTQEWYGGVSPHERSHGESFLDLFMHRFGPRSLYLLDEPESALSVHGQLQMLVRMHDLAAEGSQFIIATHSPFLMAYPGAIIYEFTDDGPVKVSWRDLDTIRITADFLANTDEFMDELLRDS